MFNWGSTSAQLRNALHGPGQIFARSSGDWTREIPFSREFEKAGEVSRSGFAPPRLVELEPMRALLCLCYFNIARILGMT
jgi:hypothetical protein